MMNFKTLIDVIERVQAGTKEITFIEGADEETCLPYSQLYHRALGVLSQFQSLGLKPGDELIFFLRNNEKFIEAFWACILGGIIPVPIAVGISEEHRSKLLRIYKALKNPYIYTNAESIELLAKYAQNNNLDDEFTNIKTSFIKIEDIKSDCDSGVIHQAKPDDIAFIQFSSGSTREPKGVVLTHQNLLATNIAMGNRFSYSEDDISLSWMPLTHDLGIIGFHLNMLVFGMSQNIMATDLFSRRPLLWMLKTHQKRASVLSSPNFGYKHYLKVYSSKDQHELDLSCIRLIINGAEPISVDLCRQFNATMAKHGLNEDTICPGYGLAEAGLSVALSPPEAGFNYACVNRHSLSLSQAVEFVDEDHPDAMCFANEGKVVDYCEMRIADEQERDLGENCIGEIQIKGDNVTSGYYGNEAANQDLFTSDCWLKTGDLGFIQDNKLIVTGRLKDIIFFNGLNYYPHDLEAVALRLPRLELGKVVAAGVRRKESDQDDILIFILFRGDLGDFADLSKNVSALINEFIGIQINHVIPVKRIPKTTSGKIQRRYLIDQFLSGEYDQALSEIRNILNITKTQSQSQGETSETEQKLLDICKKIFNGKIITRQDNLFEIGASSLDIAEFHEQLETLFSEKLDITDIFDNPSIAELAVFLDKS